MHQIGAEQSALQRVVGAGMGDEDAAGQLGDMLGKPKQRQRIKGFDSPGKGAVSG